MTTVLEMTVTGHIVGDAVAVLIHLGNIHAAIRVSDVDVPPGARIVLSRMTVDGDSLRISVLDAQRRLIGAYRCDDIMIRQPEMRISVRLEDGEHEMPEGTRLWCGFAPRTWREIEQDMLQESAQRC